MNLEFWQSINYYIQDIIFYELCLVTGYALFVKKYVSHKYYPIIYYLIGSVIMELVSKIIMNIDESSLYFKYANFFNIPFELIMLYWFLKNILKDNNIVSVWIKLNFLSIILFLIFILFKGNYSTKYASLAMSILNTALLLYCIYLLNERFKNKKIFKIPEFIFCFSFLIAYSILIIVFLILPRLIEYSPILANQLIIFRHFINIFFYLMIGYGLNQTKNIS